MDYSFFVRLEITTPDTYRQLTEEQRDRARNALLEAAEPVARRLGTFETSEPGSYLRERIGADPGAPWSVGGEVSGLAAYHFDPDTGRWICSMAYGLERNQSPFQSQVEIAGHTIGATFSVLQTAVN